MWWTSPESPSTMNDDWQKVADALRVPRKPCRSCGGRGYTSVAGNSNHYHERLVERECSRCCGTGHEIEESDL